jgi:anaerobic selenocysteine-containing dehydrogenase
VIVDSAARVARRRPRTGLGRRGNTAGADSASAFGEQLLALPHLGDEARGMAAETLRTTCSRDCPDACGIEATVDGGRVTELRGDARHPVTRGFLCFRTSRFPELQDSDQRIRMPLVRRNGELRPASWDEALDLVAQKLVQVRRESGPAAPAARSGS